MMGDRGVGEAEMEAESMNEERRAVEGEAGGGVVFLLGGSGTVNSSTVDKFSGAAVAGNRKEANSSVRI